MMKILMAPIKGIKGAGPRDSVKQGPVFSDARRCNNLEQIAEGDNIWEWHEKDEN